MEKKLYTDTKTLYINGNPVDYCCIGNLRYGEPITQKTTLENLEDFYSIDNAYVCWQLPIKISRNFKKIKINRKVYRAEDVKDIYILRQSKERKEGHTSFYNLSQKLSAPEFIEFCKDRGLGVTHLQKTIIVE